MILSNELYKAHAEISKHPIAKTSNNVLYACYSEYDDNNIWQIRVYKSEDNGISWKNTNFPTIPSYHQYFPSIRIDSGDVIHVIWYGTDNKNSAYNQLKYCNSTNGGVTWSNIYNIQPLGGYHQMYPQVEIDYKTNIIHIIWQGTDNNNANYQVKYCKSTDGGATWTLYKNIQIPHPSYPQYKPQMEIDNNSNIYVFWYGYDGTYTNKYQIKMSKSIDNGTTWSTWMNIKPNASFDQINPFIYIGSKDKLFISWYGYDTKYPSVYRVKFSTSINGGADWSDIITFSDDFQNKQMDPYILEYNKKLCITFKTQSNTSLNNRIVYITSNDDGISWISPKYISPVNEDANCPILFLDESYFLLLYNSNNLICLDKMGFRKYLIQDNLDITTFDNDSHDWKVIGSAPITPEMFEKYGFEDTNIITLENLNKLKSPIPLVSFIESGMEYNRPMVRILGDKKSDYKYQVAIQGSNSNIIKSWTQYYNYNLSDNVVVPAKLLQTANPYNIFVTVNQKEDANTVVRRGSITLYDTQPLLMASINGTRLDMTIGDVENDKVQFNIALNGKQVYPTVGQYTSFQQPPFNFNYIFKTDQIKIGYNNTATITAVDIFGKVSTLTLNFTGIYVGMIFYDQNGNMYSTDKGQTLQSLDFGRIKAGDVTPAIPIILKNQNGFTIKNISIWINSEVSGGKVEISKTLSPFKAEDHIEYEGTCDNGEQKMFYIRVNSQPSEVPGGGTFKVLTRADMA